MAHFDINSVFDTVNWWNGTFFKQNGLYYDRNLQLYGSALPAQSQAVVQGPQGIPGVSASQVIASAGGSGARVNPQASVTNTTQPCQLCPVIIPANTLVAGGTQCDIEFSFSNNNSAGVKSFWATLSGVTIGPVLTATTQVCTDGRIRMRSDGAGNLVISSVSADGQSTATYQTLALDLTKDHQLQFWGQPAVATDSMSLLGYSVQVTKAPAVSPMPSLMPGKKLFYGVNSHPGYYPVVSGPQMVALMKSLGVTVLRMDYNGAASDAAFHAYAQAFVSDGANLQLYAVLPGSLNSSGSTAYADETSAYNGEFAKAAACATSLAPHGVKMFGCGNEVDGKTAGATCVRNPALPTWTAGSKAADYNNSVFPIFRGALRGMIDGVKSVIPDAICGSNAFINTSIYAADCLWNGTQPDGTTGHPLCRWDVTDWHLYTQGDATSAPLSQGGGSFTLNQLQYISQAYGRPVFISEFNAIGTAGATTDSGNATVSTAWMNTWYQNRDVYKIASIQFYDLFDGSFQMIADDHPPYPLNQTGTAIRNFIAANPDDRA